MTYILRAEDRPLIEAALRLGDWILGERISRKQRKAVENLQDALRVLERSPARITAEYGIDARYGIEDGNGIYRAWRVGLSPAGLEIFSVFTPDAKIEFEEKIANELNFWLRPGAGESAHDGFYVKQWMDEVRDPSRIRAEATLFTVVATQD